jgi:hypothetical protein
MGRHLAGGLELDFRLFEGRIAVRVAAPNPLLLRYFRSDPKKVRPDDSFSRFLGIFENPIDKPGFKVETKIDQRLKLEYLSELTVPPESTLEEAGALATELVRCIEVA